MKFTRILGLVLVAIFAMGVVTASAMGAEDIYKVEGKKLEAKESKGITSHIKAGTEFTLKGEETILFVTIKSVTKCKKLKLDAAESPVIVGGLPGTSEKEKVEFEECTAELGGKACKSVAVESVATNNELVTIKKPATKEGDLGTLFKPAGGGKVFTKVKFTECGAFGNQTAEVEGTTAALVSPEKTEAVAGSLIYSESSSEEITEIEKHSGTKETVGLKFGGKKATINGTAEVELLSKEKWGGF
jgi:hypothetical protein